MGGFLIFPNMKTMKLGVDTISFINHLYSRTANAPEVGKGATVLSWSDREEYRDPTF